MTNYRRVICSTPEKVAVIIANADYAEDTYCNMPCPEHHDCVKCALKWLMEEAKDEKTNLDVIKDYAKDGEAEFTADFIKKLESQASNEGRTLADVLSMEYDYSESI